jgi:hypothetical protein
MSNFKMMRDKGIFLDLTPTWYDGFDTKIHDASIVMSPAFRSALVTGDDRARQRAAARVQRVLKSGVKFGGRIRYVLVLSRKDARPSQRNDVSRSQGLRWPIRSSA